MRYGNPFANENELNDLRRYLAAAIVYDDTAEVALQEWIGEQTPAALFFFDPIDCAVCINYMRQMRKIASVQRRTNDLTVATIAFNADPIGLTSLAINWGDSARVFRAKTTVPESWITPFFVVLDRQGGISFANSIINSQERQAIVAETFQGAIGYIGHSAEYTGP